MQKTLELIEKVLEGYASSKEKEQLMLWRLFSDEHELFFQKIYEEHQFAKNTNLEKIAIPDKDKLWQQILKNTNNISTSVEENY